MGFEFTDEMATVSCVASLDATWSDNLSMLTGNNSSKAIKYGQTRQLSELSCASSSSWSLQRSTFIQNPDTHWTASAFESSSMHSSLSALRFPPWVILMLTPLDTQHDLWRCECHRRNDERR
jgi:hypothetical protein